MRSDVYLRGGFRRHNWVTNWASPQAFGLWAWFPLDEMAGLVANERTHRHDGQVLTGFSFSEGSNWEFSPDGVPALHFNPTNDYLSGDADLGLKLQGDLTISAWVWMDSVPAEGDYYAIASYATTGETSATNVQYGLFIQTVGGLTSLSALHENGAGVNNRVTSTIAIAAGRWNHLTMRRMASAKWYSFMVNNVYDAGATYANNPDGGGSSTFEIGADLGGTDGFMGGWMRDVRFYNTPLPLPLIQQAFQPELRYDLWKLKRRGRNFHYNSVVRDFNTEAIADLAVADMTEIEAVAAEEPRGVQLISVP